jgi:hypothetical protein
MYLVKTFSTSYIWEHFIYNNRNKGTVLPHEDDPDNLSKQAAAKRA